MPGRRKVTFDLVMAIAALVLTAVYLTLGILGRDFHSISRACLLVLIAYYAYDRHRTQTRQSEPKP